MTPRPRALKLTCGPQARGGEKAGPGLLAGSPCASVSLLVKWSPGCWVGLQQALAPPHLANLQINPATRCLPAPLETVPHSLDPRQGGAVGVSMATGWHQAGTQGAPDRAADKHEGTFGDGAQASCLSLLRSWDYRQVPPYPVPSLKHLLVIYSSQSPHEVDTGVS